jgi:tetratricopeptide (TPR) repeat protein
MVRSVILAAAVLLFAAVQAIAADPAADWKGMRVMPKRGAVFSVGKDKVEYHDSALPWVVQDMKFGSLWVGDHRKGWVQSNQVVTLDEAPAYYTQLINNGQQKALAYSRRAIARGERGELDLAIADYGEALRLDPTGGMYVGRGAVWLEKKDYDKAIADFNEAIRLDPDDAAAYSARAGVWTVKKDYDKAIADCDEAIRLDPSFALAYNNRGEAWRKKKDYDRAVADFTQAGRLDPNEARAYNSAAWLSATCPDPRYRNGKGAVISSTEACNMTGWSNSNSINTVAAAYAEAGDFNSAVNYQNKAIDLNPTDADFVKGAKERLALYQDHKPYREE